MVDVGCVVTSVEISEDLRREKTRTRNPPSSAETGQTAKRPTWQSLAASKPVRYGAGRSGCAGSCAPCHTDTIKTNVRRSSMQ